MDSKDLPKFRFAHPIDRGAAAIVDLTISGFLSSAVIAPFQRNFLIAKYTDDLASSFDFILLNVLTFFVVHFLYSFVSNYFIGRTIGKKAFHLKVVPVFEPSNQLTWKQFILRYFIWWIDLLLLFPLLDILQDRKRRPLHDRASDAVVVSVHEEKGTGAPHPVEAKMATSMALMFLLVAAIVGIALLPKASELLEQAHLRLANEETEARLCQEVDDALVEWPSSVQQKVGQKTSQRLQVALSLFAIGQVNEECLDLEARAGFSERRDLDRTYLAKAFVTSDQSDLSDTYLKKVCEVGPDAESCLASRLLVSLSNRNEDDAEDILSQAFQVDDPFLKLWAIRHYEKTEEYEKVITLLNQLAFYRPLGSFLSSRRVIALWGLKKQAEARVAFSTSIPNLDHERAINLAGWMCVKELENGCPQKTPESCAVISEGAKKSNIDMSLSLLALAYFKTFECESDIRVGQLRTISDTVSQADVLHLLKAKEFLVRQKIVAAKEELTMLLKTASQNYFKQEALVRLVDLTQTKEELKKIENRWLQRPGNKEQPSSGPLEGIQMSQGNLWVQRKFFDRYLRFNAFAEAARVGEHLLESEPSNESLRKKVVVLSFRSGDLRRAWELEAGFRENRIPASDNNHSESESIYEANYKKVSSALEKKFGSP